MTTKRVDTAREAEHEYICGSTGSGKSSHVKRAIAKARRVVVFDRMTNTGSWTGSSGWNRRCSFWTACTETRKGR